MVKKHKKVKATEIVLKSDKTEANIGNESVPISYLENSNATKAGVTFSSDGNETSVVKFNSSQTIKTKIDNGDEDRINEKNTVINEKDTVTVDTTVETKSNEGEDETSKIEGETIIADEAETKEKGFDQESTERKTEKGDFWKKRKGSLRGFNKKKTVA